MMMRGILAALAIAVCSLTGGAGVAQADDESYLAYLRDHGYNWPPVPPGAQLNGGRIICDALRGGQTPEQVAASYNRFPSIMPAGWIEAAQHELCPETLG